MAPAEVFYVEPVEAVLRRFVEDFRNVVGREGSGEGLLAALRPSVEQLVDDPTWVGPEFRRAVAGDVAAWAVYRSQAPDLCIFTMVVPPDEATKVHNHHTDGWVACVQGEQRERNYRRTDDGSREGHAELELTEDKPVRLGELTSIAYPDADIHQVLTTSPDPSVSLHVLCNDLGTVERQSFDPDQRSVENFVSGYTNVDGSSSIGHAAR